MGRSAYVGEFTSQSKRLLLHLGYWYKAVEEYSSGDIRYQLITDESEFVELAIKELECESSGCTFITLYTQ